MIPLVMLIGVAVCLFALISHWSVHSPITSNGRIAQATIVELKQCEAPQSSDLVFRPVVQFVTECGRSVITLCDGYHDYFAANSSRRTGDTVAIIYSPDEPEKVLLAGNYRRLYWIILGFGTLWCVAGTLMLLYPSP